ncbi:MAG TPA: hypothetical protein VJM12_18785 [Pyrinomonadaceae bacterium]|nr:hypothetical protein [Pyrinomonadaceae bacterium]
MRKSHQPRIVLGQSLGNQVSRYLINQLQGVSDPQRDSALLVLTIFQARTLRCG